MQVGDRVKIQARAPSGATEFPARKISVENESEEHRYQETTPET